MKLAIAVAGMAATGLVAGGVLVMAAGAETTTTSTPPASPPLRSVSVQGVAHESVVPTASAEAATAVYRQAMAAAITDGQSKAQFLAEKTGATLGQIQSIGEGGGSIQCPEDVEYQGGEPDFGAGTAEVYGAVAPRAESRVAPTARKKLPVKHRPKRRTTAKKAAAESCTIDAQVMLVYQLS
jgi:hypothetical protein